MKTKKYVAVLGVLAGVAVLSGSVANATHSWGKYHWNLSTEQTLANPLKLGDNLSTVEWQGSLAGASTDWNASVLKNMVVAGISSASCDPTLGQVEVCNGEYGNNGWLGIAQIWIYRGKDGHIAQALVKVNDTYFNSAPYNTAAWRQSVMCQEVGHTFGLGHQDENFSNANLGTCMDYTSDPDGTLADPDQLSNLHPNQHDYDMLTEIYTHLNSTDGSSPGNGKGKPASVGVTTDLNNPSEWGQAIRQDAQGKNSLFERNLGNGNKIFTFVIWAN